MGSTQNPHHRQETHNLNGVAAVSLQVLPCRVLAMSNSEGDQLFELARARVCPNCGKAIAEGTAVGRGAGSFCSLECVALYHQAEFDERARRLAMAARQ